MAWRVQVYRGTVTRRHRTMTKKHAAMCQHAAQVLKIDDVTLLQIGRTQWALKLQHHGQTRVYTDVDECTKFLIEQTRL